MPSVRLSLVYYRRVRHHVLVIAFSIIIFPPLENSITKTSTKPANILCNVFHFGKKWNWFFFFRKCLWITFFSLSLFPLSSISPWLFHHAHLPLMPPSPTCMSSHWSPSPVHPVPLLSSPYPSSYPLYPSLLLPSTLLPLLTLHLSSPFPSLTHNLPPSIGTPPAPLGSSISSSPPPPVSPPSPWLVSTAVVSEGQMTGELAPGRALSHPGAIRLVANNRCFRPGGDQSGGIMGNVRSSAFYTSAQMDEITLVSF